MNKTMWVLVVLLIGAAAFVAISSTNRRADDVQGSAAMRREAPRLGESNGATRGSDQEHRRDAEVFSTPLHGDCAIAGDGDVYVRGRAGIVRFDGKEWRDVAEMAGPYHFLLAGRGGVVIGKFGERAYRPELPDHWHLLAGGKLYQGDMLRDLILEHTEIVRDAFSGTGADWVSTGYLLIAVDAQGNIWVTPPEPSLLQTEVLAGGKWIRAWRQILLRPGAHPPIFISPVGDGSKVYISEQPYGTYPAKGYLAAVVDGKLRVEDMPCTIWQAPPSWRVRDGQGGLWIPVQSKEQDAVDSLRLTEKGIVETVKGSNPWCADAGGAVWLRGAVVRSYPDPSMRIWAGGKITDGPDGIPWEAGLPLSATSYCVLTRQGLQCYAEQPKLGFVETVLLVPPKPFPRDTRIVGRSRHGFLILKTRSDKGECTVHAIRVPT